MAGTLKTSFAFSALTPSNTPSIQSRFWHLALCGSHSVSPSQHRQCCIRFSLVFNSKQVCSTPAHLLPLRSLAKLPSSFKFGTPYLLGLHPAGFRQRFEGLVQELLMVLLAAPDQLRSCCPLHLDSKPNPFVAFMLASVNRRIFP